MQASGRRFDAGYLHHLGQFVNTPEPCTLGLDCSPGDSVCWEDAEGREHEGRLRHWDGLVAVVETDDGEVVTVNSK